MQDSHAQAFQQMMEKIMSGMMKPEDMPRMGMCGEMLTTMQQTTAMAAFATPELRQMFGEWMATLEAMAMETVRPSGATDAAGLAKVLGIGEEGARYPIAHRANSDNVGLRVKAAKTS